MPDSRDRPAVNHPGFAPEQEREICEMVAAHVESFENGLGVDLKENNEKRYRQYRGARQFADAWVKTGPNDKDAVLYDAKKHWGAALHIPLSFRTIETMVPRAIAHRPRLLYLPRQERHAENVQNVRLLIDAQQDNIDIDLPFQAVMRSGRIYGLGVGKTYWRKEYSLQRRMKRRTFSKEQFVLDPPPDKPPRRTCTFDDPFFEDVDIFDFMWDPYGSDMSTCEYVVHRLWLSLDRCLERIESGAWNTIGAQALDEDKLRSMGNGQKYDEVWQARMEASGLNMRNAGQRGEQIHEVWEWHNGQEVLTVLDRCLLVQSAENPCVGTIPFQVYRPTPLQKQMVGIGDLEPLEHLQRELDTLRSQRRDAATLVLAAPLIFDSTVIDEENLAIGPGVMVPVEQSVDVRSAIQQLQIRDVPGSGYQEEQVIRQDFDAVSGISDAMDPSTSQAQTATEAQIVQAALSARIALASRRFEIEVVRGVAKCFLHLNQRMILKDRPGMRLPDEGLDESQAAEEGRWRWFPIGPGALQGEFEIIPEGGSMAQRNVPQDRQDAQLFLQLAQNPHLDPRRCMMAALELLGKRDIEAWLKPAQPVVPAQTIEVLKRAFSPAAVDQAVMVAQREDPQLAGQEQGPEQGPNVQQVDQMMGAPGG